MKLNRAYRHIEVAHGYTVGDIDGLAGIAVKAVRRVVNDYISWHPYAWSVIAGHLAEASTRPDHKDLIRLAYAAIFDEIYVMLRDRGSPRIGGNNTGARYWTYWTPQPYAWHEDPPLVERIAVRQAMAVLSELMREAIQALADTDSYTEAAKQLGIKRATLYKRIETARAQLHEVWFYPDKPPARLWRQDRRKSHRPKNLMCGKGLHPMDDNNAAIRRGKKPGTTGGFYCRACKKTQDAARPPRNHTQKKG